jgi:hypothetical protein
MVLFQEVGIKGARIRGSEDSRVWILWQFFMNGISFKRRKRCRY